MLKKTNSSMKESASKSKCSPTKTMANALDAAKKSTTKQKGKK